MLIISQVVLSMQLGFAVVPLIFAVSDKESMGKFAIKPIIKVLAWLATVAIVVLNGNLVFDQLREWQISGQLGFWIYPIEVFTLGAATLLIYIVAQPLVVKRRVQIAAIHSGPASLILPQFSEPRKTFGRIGIAVDFSDSDIAAVSEAVKQGGSEATYYLFHVVESAGARLMGHEIQDLEANTDEQQLEKYAKQLQANGFAAQWKLGFGSPAKGLARLANSGEVEVLVMASHGHTGLLDFFLGETVDRVRHRIEIPLLIVNKKGRH